MSGGSASIYHYCHLYLNNNNILNKWLTIFVFQVSILINNAGIVTGKKFMETADELIIKTMEVNTMAHFWVSINTIIE